MAATRITIINLIIVGKFQTKAESWAATQANKGSMEKKTQILVDNYLYQKRDLLALPVDYFRKKKNAINYVECFGFGWFIL